MKCLQFCESVGLCAEDGARYEKELEEHPGAGRKAERKAERKAKKKATATEDGPVKTKARACALMAALAHSLIPLLWIKQLTYLYLCHLADNSRWPEIHISAVFGHCQHHSGSLRCAMTMLPFQYVPLAPGCMSLNYKTLAPV